MFLSKSKVSSAIFILRRMFLIISSYLRVMKVVSGCDSSSRGIEW